MIVYYRGPCAHITNDLLEVWSPEHRVFRIGDLRSVYVVHGDAGPGAGPVPYVAMLGAVGLAATVLLGSAWLAVAVLAFVVAAGAVAVVARLGLGRQAYELHAVYEGQEVRLFGCADAQTFGQVRRALARAIERHAEREWRTPY